MANVPSYTTDRFSFGPGIIYLGPVGATPTIDIGAVKGDMELVISRTALEVEQGSPQTLVKQYVIEERVSLKATKIEWNADNLPYFIGAGVTTAAAGAVDTYHFGGDVNIAERAVRLLHIMPNGATVDIHLYRTQAVGDVSIAIKETDIHEFPFEFRCLESSTDFTGAATLTNRKLFRIVHTRI